MKSLLRYPRRQLSKAHMVDDTPVPTLLPCPECGELHEDTLEDSGKDWSRIQHRTHLCHYCEATFRPYNRFYTIGVSTGGLIPPVLFRYKVITEASPLVSWVFGKFGKPFREARKYNMIGYHVSTVIWAYRIGNRLLLRAPLLVIKKRQSTGGVDTLRETVRQMEEELSDLWHQSPADHPGDIASGLLEELQSQNPALYHELKAGSLTDWSEDNGKEEAEERK